MPYKLRLLSYFSLCLALAGVFFLVQPPQTQISPSSQITANGSVLAGSTGGVSWQQSDFSGGVNAGPFTIPWGSNGGWNYYASQSGSIITTSVFDAGGAGLSFSLVNLDGSCCISIGAGEMIRSASTANAVTSAPWVNSGSCGALAYRYFQVQFDSSSYKGIAINKLDRIDITGHVADAKTGLGISGATVTVSGVAGKTAFLPKNTDKSSSFFGSLIGDVYAAGQPPPPPAPGDFTISPAIGSGSYSISVSASGYNSQTKSVSWSIGTNGCGFSVPSTSFSLTKVPSTAASNPPAPISAAPTAPATLVLPTTFMQTGSETTDLSKITDKKDVTNFTLEIPKKDKIVFKSSLDLSSASSSAALAKLDQYVKINETGVVEVDSKAVPFLNKKATITMFNLAFSSTPKILVDGKESSGVVSNINYVNHTLTFDVAHFTKFQAVDGKVQTTVTTKSNSLFQIIGLALVALAVVVFGSGYFVYKKRRKQVSLL